MATGAGHDTIDFSTAAFANFAAVKSHMVQSGANVIITLDSADTITLKGVTLASLTAADFTFHAGTAPAAPASRQHPHRRSPLGQATVRSSTRISIMAEDAPAQGRRQRLYLPSAGDSAKKCATTRSPLTLP